MVVVVVVTMPLVSSNEDDEEVEEPLVLLVVFCVSTRPLTSTPAARLEADADLVELKVAVGGGFLPTTFCNSAPNVTEAATGEEDRDLVCGDLVPPPPFVDRDRERRFWPEIDDDDDDCLL